MVLYFRCFIIVLIIENSVALLPIDYYADKQLGSYIFKHVNNVTYVANSNKSESPHLGMHLKNGLKILFMNDHSWTNQVKITLDVNVGSLACNSPGNEQIAHIVEHLICKGKKMVNASSDDNLSTFILKRQGDFNAYTKSNHTGYSFEVFKVFLGATLDRFVNSFTSPNLSHESVTKEFAIVTDEFLGQEKNIDWSMVRIWNTSEGLCLNRNHRMHLSPPSPNLTEEVNAFFRKYYRPGLMTITVQNMNATSKAILTTVLKKFKRLNSTKKVERFVVPIDWKPAPSMVQYVLNSDTKFLEVNFRIPYYGSYETYHFGQRVSAVLNERRPDSFAEFSKNMQLIEGVQAEVLDEYFMYFVPQPIKLFSITIFLTENGLKYHEAILQLLFSHLMVMKTFSQARWLEAYPMNPKMQFGIISELMHDYTFDNALLETHTADFQPGFQNSMMTYLSSSNFYFRISAGQLPGKLYDQACGDYNYTLEPIRQKLFDQCNPQITDPLVNHIKNIAILRNTFMSSEKPVLIYNNTEKILWHKYNPKDKSNVAFLIRTTGVDFRQARNILLKNILHDMVVKLASKSGYSTTFKKLPNGFTAEYSLNLYGANHDTEYLFSLFKLDHELLIVQKLFNETKKKILGLDDRLPKESLKKIGPDYFKALANGDLFIFNETMFAECQNVTLMDVIQYTKNLFSQIHVECLISGNVLESEALSLFHSSVNFVVDQFSSKPSRPNIAEINYPQSEMVINKIAKNDVQSLTIVGFRIDVKDIRAVATFKLFYSLLNAETFFKLRMVEYLGYNPSFKYLNTFTGDYAMFSITGLHDSKVAEEKIEELRQSLTQMVAQLKKNVFELAINYQLGYYKHHRDPIGNNWNAINSGTYNFDSGAQFEQELMNMTKKTVQNVLEDYLMPGSPKFQKLVLHIQNEQKHLLTI